MKSASDNTVNIPALEAIEAERERLRYWQIFRNAIRILIMVAILALAISTFSFTLLRVSGSSMNPALKDKDIVVLKKTDQVVPGDLCGFYCEDQLFLKRVIGKAGDTIEISPEGQVSVNGTLLEEPYVEETIQGDCDITFPYQVPEDSYFVLSDMRTDSSDSRSNSVGCIRKDQIVGKALFRIWPVKRISLLK